MPRERREIVWKAAQGRWARRSGGLFQLRSIFPLLAGLTFLGGKLQAQGPRMPNATAVPVRRLGLMEVDHVEPHAPPLSGEGYVLIRDAHQWRRFVETYHLTGRQPLPAHVTFRDSVVLGVFVTGSGCGAEQPFVKAIERLADTLQVVFAWGFWGDCLGFITMIDLVWLPEPVGPLGFVHQERSGTRSKAPLTRFELPPR